VHGLQTSIPARLPDLYASSTRTISTNTIKREERPRHSDGGQDSRHKYDGGQELHHGQEAEVDAGPEVNAGQEVELEVGRA